MNGTDTWRKIFNWTLQIFTWWSFYFLFRNTLHGHISINNLLITAVIYFIYIINNFICSDTYTFLEHLMKSKNLNDYFRNLVKTPIVKKFKVENWHYESALISGLYSDKRNKQKIIISSTEMEDFMFESWRDISGPLLLEETSKPYLKLSLAYELTFDDDRSKEDYDRQKDCMIQRNKGKDIYLKFDEETIFEGFEPLILLRLNKKEDTFINLTVYFIFTVILPIVEIYKLYIESQCAHQEFIIRKIVSTHKNLTMPEYENKFVKQKPSIVYNGNIQYISADESADGEKMLLENNKDKLIFETIKNPTVELSIKSHDKDEFAEPLIKKE